MATSLTETSVAPTQRPEQWPLLTGAAGALLVVEVALAGAADAALGEASGLWIASTGGSLLALVAALVFPGAGSLLLVFPLTLLVSLATLGEGAAAAADEATRAGVFVATLLLFAVGASLWLSRPDGEDDTVRRATVPAREKGSAGSDRARFAAAGALLLLPILAVPWRGASEAEDGRILLALVAVAFGWSMAYYLYFVGPALAWELEVLSARSRATREVFRAGAGRWWVRPTLLLVSAGFLLATLLHETFANGS